MSRVRAPQVRRSVPLNMLASPMVAMIIAMTPRPTSGRRTILSRINPSTTMNPRPIAMESIRGRWYNYYDRGINYSVGSSWGDAEHDLKKAIGSRSKDRESSLPYYDELQRVGVRLAPRGKARAGRREARSEAGRPHGLGGKPAAGPLIRSIDALG